MDIGSVRRVIEVARQPAPTVAELEEIEPEEVEEDAEDR